MASQDNQNLLKLFQRPLEPSFFPKDDGKTVFDLPPEFYTDRYKSVGVELQTRFGGDADNVIHVRGLGQLPDISFASVIPRNGPFSLFNSLHQKTAGQLIEMFLNQPDPNSLMSLALYCKDRVNIFMFQYALAVAINHRDDTKDINVPSIVEMFPDQFVDPEVFPRLREEGRIPQQSRMRIEIARNYTASDAEPEQRVAYFREDIGVNAHHWHWHLVFPGSGPARIVNKDRRGELFFEMHSQIIARYNVERLANGLEFIKNLGNFREPVKEAYFPKLLRGANNRTYAPRSENAILRDIKRPADGVDIEISDMERWRDRILEAIDAGFVFDKNGQRIPLDEVKGIDILGNIVEACDLTVNRELYGNLHNEGHNILAYIHDPDGRHLEDYGVVGDVTTAMRDPAFYRWHGFLDFIWLKHKNKLTPYPSNKLDYPGIAVNAFELQLVRGSNPPPNLLLTFWQKSDVDLGVGLDFGPGNVFATFTHLQHAPFNYRIRVNNTTGSNRQGTCRIYCCPKFKERGQTMTLEEKRFLMIEMDKFTVNLRPGENTVVRRSDESSITIPYDRTFRKLGETVEPTEANRKEQFRFCGCGWPQHMLVPKGTAEGMQFEFIAMVSNYADDLIDGPIDPSDCGDAHSFCGLRNKKFPDKRSMGYPYDRKFPETMTTLESVINQYNNFQTCEVTIKFKDRVIEKL